MARSTVASLIALLLGASIPLQAGDNGTVEEAAPKDLLKQALALWHEHEDYNRAQAVFYEAVNAAPADPDIRFSRAMFFETVASLVKESDRPRFLRLAREDYRETIQLDPSGRVGGMARDRLAILEGRQLFSNASGPQTCDEQALEFFHRAETLFGAGQYHDALTPFKMAADRCPASATIWTSYADAHYALGEFEMARTLFARALESAPWSRDAHRFLADTEAELGNPQVAARESALAVISDPTWEAAWEALRGYSVVRSSSWRRVPGDRSNSPAAASRPEPDRVAWNSYESLKSALLSGRAEPVADPAHAAGHGQPPTALERTQKMVRTTLDTWRNHPGAADEDAGSFWAMMARADTAGYLDEAIFLHLMDPSLAAEYRAFRDKYKDRLITYIETVIAPPTLPLAAPPAETH